MKKLVIGILAHVDAGKTTLAEGILYLTGSIRKLGRVDHKNTFLDTYELERARGITIFSKQAEFVHQNLEVTLLDTPGHVDFSAEMERTLQVLDYAILVISGSDGVQGHTETLWRLLKKYRIPTFLFINKMDLEGTDRNRLLSDLKKRLDEGCVDFSEGQKPDAFMENLAMCDELLLERYMEQGTVSAEDTIRLVADRKVFPCYFGSALKLDGVDGFLDGLGSFTESKTYPEDFGAKIFKITRDDQGSRLTYMKITGGSLKVKMLLTNKNGATSHKEDASGIWEEKVDQIRIYSGVRYETTEEVTAGKVCAVTGLSRSYPGEGLGIEAMSDMPVLEPVLNYQILLPAGYDAFQVISKLKQLEEEDPLLHIVWSEQLKEIHVQLMGEVQVEILKSLIAERFGINVEFGQGNIVYKETIRTPVIGVGHFEPLRHYAEVHLLMEPDEPGSGLSYQSSCSEDILERSWQRLILTHLEEKEHVGVLTGSPITDMKITLITGRAHLKHTEGGDFRQATYRAVRQGLMSAQNILLEPYYHYRLEIPSEMIGRAMSDIQRMCGTFASPEIDGDMSILEGLAPVALMRGYQAEVTAYTRGRGRLFCTLKGYQPCHNAEEIIQAIGYDSESDLDNPAGSVFCAHGAGFLVGWESVRDYMHLDSGRQPESQEQGSEEQKSEEQRAEKAGDHKITDRVPDPTMIRSEAHRNNAASINRSGTDYRGSLQEDKELEDIFVRTFGPLKQRTGASRSSLGYERRTENSKGEQRMTNSPRETNPVKELKPVMEYLLVDGYNIIFSWEELNELAKINMDAARNKLMDLLCNYQGFKKCILILVFDAYRVKGGVGDIQDYHNIHVVYTKEAETADQYIEKVTHEIAKENRVTVATSDALEQMIILGQGAIRFSANDLKEEILRIRDQIRRDYLDRQQGGRAYLKEQFAEDILEFLKDDYKEKTE